MKVNKKIIYALGALTIVSVPLITIISCDSDDKSDNKGILVDKSDYSAVYWDSDSKLVTIEINFGKTTNEEDAHKKTKPIFTEIYGILPKLAKAIENINKKDINVNLTIMSRGNTKSGKIKYTELIDTTTAAADYIKNIFIEILKKCGWNNSEAIKIMTI